ncbi:hypothetical protein V8F20_010894 [Naviculisporaceae sp. PSN 640]
MCPHYSFQASQTREWLQAAETERKIVLECQECFTDLPPSAFAPSAFRDQTYQPRLVVFTTPDYRTFGTGDIIATSHTYHLQKLWEIPVFKVSDSTRNAFFLARAASGLKEAQARHGGIACPHLRFDDGRLLDELACRDFSCLEKLEAQSPFLRAWGGLERQHENKKRLEIASCQATCPLHDHHDDCVCELPWDKRQWHAFYADWGKFEMESQEREKMVAQSGVYNWACHRVCCELCNAEYKWTRRGNEFWISFRQGLPVCTGPLTSAWKHESFTNHLIDCIDPASYGHYKDNQAKHVTWCPDKSCGNGKRGDVRHAWARSKVPRVGYPCCSYWLVGRNRRLNP